MSSDTHGDQLDAGPPPPDISVSMETAAGETDASGAATDEERALMAAMAAAVDAGPPPIDVLVGFGELPEPGAAASEAPTINEEAGLGELHD